MNILGLVFSLLLILSYGFYACWDKQTGSSRLRTTYVGHQKVNRKILNKYQSEVYENLQGKGSPATPKEKSEPTGGASKKPELNRGCARLNIWPLIQEGREAHEALYELMAKLIRTFYAPLEIKEKRFEYHFLDTLLSSAKSALQAETPFALEKILLEDPHFRKIYYKMLRGTKQVNLSAQIGYPSLLDYVKAEEAKEKVCLFHAHPDLIAVFFGPEVAENLYAEIHKQGGSLLTKELIEKFCSEAHQISVDEKLLELLELGKPTHKEYKKTLIAEDEKSDVYLRKNVYLKG